MTEAEVLRLASAGCAVQMREERYSADGVAIGVEGGTDYDGTPTTFVLADFGGEQPGRIPLRRFTEPRRTVRLVDAGMDEQEVR